MSRAYLVQLPRAEARHLAGAGPGWPATAEARCLAAIREWLQGLQRRRAAAVPVGKVVTELTVILSLAPAATRPVRGPFAAPAAGGPPPGRAEYLGGGLVRLDEEAISTLAGLADGEDFLLATPAPVLC